MNIVALTGLAGAGKSTAANALVAQFGWARVSFAEPLRSMLLALGLTPAELHAKHEPIAWLGGRTPRELLQSLGTEWGRQRVAERIWVESARRRILSALQIGDFPGIVLDDCRFDNEAQMVHDMGGMVVKIDRPGLVRMSHVSENGVLLGLIDHTIFNDSDSPQQLQNQLTNLVIHRVAA